MEIYMMMNLYFCNQQIFEHYTWPLNIVYIRNLHANYDLQDQNKYLLVTYRSHEL